MYIYIWKCSGDYAVARAISMIPNLKFLMEKVECMQDVMCGPCKCVRVQHPSTYCYIAGVHGRVVKKLA